jgi:purine-nucleoside phosphorylase
MKKLQEKLQEATAWIQSRITIQEHTVALTLGSGLGNFAERVENPTVIDTEEIPHFPTPSVAGHHGELIFGTVKSKPVVLLKGRVHLYEGRSVEEVTFYVRLLNMLGVKAFILTNAAGGVNPHFDAGELCLILDVINLMFAPNLNFKMPTLAHEPLFDKGLQQVARNSARACGILLREGVYAGVLGPSYETRAEIRMLQTLHADLVGMSTVLEAIAAKHLGMKVLGISLVTNKAAGLSDEVLSHDDVQAVAQRAQREFSRLIETIVAQTTTH